MHGPLWALIMQAFTNPKGLTSNCLRATCPAKRLCFVLFPHFHQPKTFSSDASPTTNQLSTNNYQPTTNRPCETDQPTNDAPSSQAPSSPPRAPTARWSSAWRGWPRPRARNAKKCWRRRSEDAFRRVFAFLWGKNWRLGGAFMYFCQSFFWGD